jgi:hypothetical protein
MNIWTSQRKMEFEQLWNNGCPIRELGKIFRLSTQQAPAQANASLRTVFPRQSVRRAIFESANH